MKKLITFVTLAAVFLALPLLVACGPAPTPPPKPPAEAKTLTIGCTLPFTNSMGIDTKKALEMIIPAFNEAGGLTIKGQRYNLDVIIYDDKYTGDGGRAAVERLVNEDKVKFIVCQIGSAPIIAGLAVTEPAKVLVFCGGASDKIISPQNLYTYGTATWRTNLPPLFPLLQKAFPNAKTMVNLSPDDETGKALARDHTKLATALGIKVLDSIFYPRETQDFAPFATKIMSLKPDIMDYPGTLTGTQFGLQFKALYEAGFKGAHISPMPPNWVEVLAVTPKESMEGLISILPATEVDNPSPMAKKFKADWTAKYGEWSTASLIWTSALYAFVEAVKKADSVDPEAVAKVLSTTGLAWESPNGKYLLVKRPDLKNDRFCDTCSSLDFSIYRSGKVTYLGTVTAEESLQANQTAFGGGDWK